MTILSPDGSIYGDGVACYAIRFAALGQESKRLLLHFQDGKINQSIAEAGFNELARECDSFVIKYLQGFISYCQCHWP